MTVVTPLNPAQCAAVYIMLLGENEAASLLAKLQPDELETVGSTMCALGDIAPGRIAHAIAGFIAEADNQALSARGREAQLGAMLTKAVGEKKSESLMERIAPEAELRSVEIARWLSPAILATMIEEEHPQVIAVLLLMLEVETSAIILASLPAEVQPAVVERIARMDKVSGEAVAMLDELLSGRISQRFGASVLNIGGAREAANLINLADQHVGETVMPAIEERDAGLARAIKEEMFTFDMLYELDAKDMGRLLRDVESQDLVTALKGLEEDNRDIFFTAMSSRAADGVRDEIDMLPKLKRADVVAAQKAIVDVARKLKEDGEITLGTDDGEFV